MEWREQVAREKRRAFRDWTYWGRPVPGFGDPGAELVILGLAVLFTPELVPGVGAGRSEAMQM